MLLPTHLLAQRSQPVPKASPSQRLQPAQKVQPAQKAQPADAFAILYYEMMKRHLKDCINMPKACGKFSEEDLWKMIGRSPVVLNDVIVFVKNNYKNPTGDIMKKEVGEIFKKLYAAGASARDRAAAREELDRIIPREDARDYARLIHLGDVWIAEVHGFNYYEDFRMLGMMKQLPWQLNIEMWEKGMGYDGGGGGGGGGKGSAPGPQAGLPNVSAGVTNAVECMKGHGGAKTSKGGGFGAGGPPQNEPVEPGPEGPKTDLGGKPVLPSKGDFNQKANEDCNPLLEGENKEGQVSKDHPLKDFEEPLKHPSDIKYIAVTYNGNDGHLEKTVEYNGIKWEFHGLDSYPVGTCSEMSIIVFKDGEMSNVIGVPDQKITAETIKAHVSEGADSIDYDYKGDKDWDTYTDSPPSTDGGTAETPSPTEGGGGGACNKADALAQLFSCFGMGYCPPGGKAVSNPGGGDYVEPQLTSSNCHGGGGGGMLILPPDGVTDPERLIELKKLIGSGASQADIKNAAMKAFGGKGP